MAANPKKIQENNAELATFYVGKALCGIDILSIQEINKHFEVTTVPQAPDYVVGVLNLRGRIVTILDLGKKLGLSQIRSNKKNRNIIVRSQDELVGLMVDSISDVVTSDQDRIEPAPSNISGMKGKFFRGVMKTQNALIGILDIEEVLKE
ncbi:CheW2 [Desulfamplus magnetovallimortis]|uniref:CheW2 n=1 Tax=Desulfamplus magnetovallimortis TaxID=1246637 RepID=A0A1W1H604_9BACT|nr:chemotaxis protein CheW [Desulfamplus magnetovallimortis]SLM27798.1 CheW2 [Desulfamplus magnetovallimortis]